MIGGWLPSLTFALSGRSVVSWYGKHPRYPKDEIKSLLPPGACKLCVYWFRTVIGSSPDDWHQAYSHCPRCGIPQWELLSQLNAHLLGKDAPVRQPTPRRIGDSILGCLRNSIGALWKSSRKLERPKTRDALSALDKWLSLYQSTNRDVKTRAARALLGRPDAPLWVLLDVLDNLGHKGLGAAAEKALLKRGDVELLTEMVRRLVSSNNFIREVACNVLGRIGDPAATPHLLRTIDDPHVMVRRAAAFGLAHLKDPSAIPELKRQFTRHRNDDINVVWALQSALQALGVEIENAR